MELLTLPIGQDQSHPIHPQCLPDPRRNGLENIAQFKVRDHAVVQVQDELELGLFLFQLRPHLLGLGKVEPIVDGQGRVVAQQRKKTDFLLGEGIPMLASNAERAQAMKSGA